VELRFFGGLTVEETAEAMNISPATVKRHWAVARAWLARELAPDAAPGTASRPPKGTPGDGAEPA
jgi:DNA-directed RNA polymerase specialized sigma24 family protein